MMRSKKEKRIEAECHAWRQKARARAEAALERAIANQEKNAHGRAAKLHEAMRYALLGGGKRLRPLLALAAGEAVGGGAREALPAAAAVEMLHAYSLIHDDLPCMDDDDLRRGKPTCHRAFGEATALLAADALHTLAFETLAESGTKSMEAARRVNASALILARAAGAAGMVGGQILDLAFEGGENVDIDMVRFMERAKTGELISASLVCGALLAGGSPLELKRLRNLGFALGLAFQIKDDLLNLSGDPKILGKAVGSDAARGKASFPAILGEEGARAELAALTEKAQALAAPFGAPGLPLRFLVQCMADRDM